MSIFDGRVWGAVLLGLLLAYGGGRWQQSRTDATAYEAERNKAALSAARDQVKAVDDARAEEQRRTAEQTEIANAANKETNRARVDARTAAAASVGLQQRIDQLLAAARSAGNSQAASSSPGKPGGDPLDVLVDVLRRSDSASGELAVYADNLRIAGLFCERAYDSLTASAPSTAQ